ncbi:hypothetical protein J6590_023024 [Homalodisca vitripennis]|nr:hypothetical protein J6590_023024 [Homalodisca vitripennis]
MATVSLTPSPSRKYRHIATTQEYYDSRARSLDELWKTHVEVSLAPSPSRKYRHIATTQEYCDSRATVNYGNGQFDTLT